MLDFLNDILWGKILIALLITIGIGFTVASRFVQFRYFGRMFRILSASQAFKLVSNADSDRSGQFSGLESWRRMKSMRLFSSCAASLQGRALRPSR